MDTHRRNTHNVDLHGRKRGAAVAARLPDSRAGRLLDKLRHRARTRRGGWHTHLATAGAVSGFLAFLNLVTPSSHPWVLYVAGAWIIPLTVHGIIRRRRDHLQQKLESRPWLSDTVFRPFRRLHRGASAFRLVAGIAGSTSLYLVMINLLTGAPFWAPIPVASLAFPVVLLFGIFRARGRRLMEEIEELGGLEVGELEMAPPIGSNRGPESGRDEARAPGAAAARSTAGAAFAPGTDSPGELDNPVLKAGRVAENLRPLLEHAGAHKADLERAVENVLEEVAKLAALEDEFRRASASISVEELERDRALVEARLADAEHADTHRHYEASLRQIDRQLQSYRELNRRREVLQLRLRTAVNSLHQLHMDLVAVKGEAALAGADGLFARKSDELADYLSDLRASYDELARDLGEA